MFFWVILKYICTVLVENSQTSSISPSLSWPQVQKYYSEANAANDNNLQRNKSETAGSACQKCACFYSSCHLASFTACSLLGHYGKLEIHVSPCGLRSAVTPQPNQNSWTLSVKVIEKLGNNQLAAHKIPTCTCSPEQTDMLIQLNEHEVDQPLWYWAAWILWCTNGAFLLHGTAHFAVFSLHGTAR